MIPTIPQRERNWDFEILSEITELEINLLSISKGLKVVKNKKVSASQH
jgi:hypothetical protein